MIKNFKQFENLLNNMQGPNIEDVLKDLDYNHKHSKIGDLKYFDICIENSLYDKIDDYIKGRGNVQAAIDYGFTKSIDEENEYNYEMVDYFLNKGVSKEHLEKTLDFYQRYGTENDQEIIKKIKKYL